MEYLAALWAGLGLFQGVRWGRSFVRAHSTGWFTAALAAIILALLCPLLGPLMFLED